MKRTKEFSCPWWVYEAISDRISPVTWVTGGIGSGKSTGSAIWFLSRVFENSDSQMSWAVAPTYTKVEQILLPTFRQVLRDVWEMHEEVHYKIYRGRFFKIVFNNYPHEIHLLSGDRPNLFVGSNIAAWLVTEVGLQDREVYEKLQQRLRCPRAKILQGMAEGSPEGMNWYAEIANFPENTRNAQGHYRFRLETTDNRHLKPSPEHYAQTKIRDVYAYDTSKVLSYEKGLFVSFAKGSAYWEFVESRNVVPAIEASPTLALLFSWDFNKHPLAWTVTQQVVWTHPVTFERCVKYVTLAESCGEARGILDACAEFKARFPVEIFGRTPIEIYGDRTGYDASHKAGRDYDQILEYLTQTAGYKQVDLLAEKNNPRVKATLEKLAAAMAYDMYAVASNCVRTINSFLKTSLKPGTWDIDKPQDDLHTHYADTVRYLMFEKLRDVNVTRPSWTKAQGASW